MADPVRLSDPELERALRATGPRYPYPPTPNMAAAVRARLTAGALVTRQRRPVWREGWRVALAAAIVLVILGGAALINPATRDAIAHFFHVPGVVLSRVPSPLPSPSNVTSLNLGELTTMDQAASMVRFRIVVPPQLGTPDAVYVDRSVPGGEVALAYKPRTGVALVPQTGLGVLVTEFRGDLIPGFITKQVGPGTTVEEVSVNGDPGWWIAGQPHDIIVSDRSERLRMAANTLVWEHGGVTYRIESGLTKAEAMRLAAGLP